VEGTSCVASAAGQAPSVKHITQNHCCAPLIRAMAIYERVMRIVPLAES
jgi:hypothetical protein